MSIKSINISCSSVWSLSYCCARTAFLLEQIKIESYWAKRKKELTGGKTSVPLFVYLWCIHKPIMAWNWMRFFRDAISFILRTAGNTHYSIELRGRISSTLNKMSIYAVKIWVIAWLELINDCISNDRHFGWNKKVPWNSGVTHFKSSRNITYRLN